MSAKAPLKLEEFLPYLVNRVGAALVERFSREALTAHGLSIDMWRVLAALADSGGQRQIDLAGATSIEASTVSRIVTRLTRDGLVTRTRSTESSREVAVRLSPRGRALVRRLVPIARRLEQKAVVGLPAPELASVKNALRRIYGNIAGR